MNDLIAHDATTPANVEALRKQAAEHPDRTPAVIQALEKVNRTMSLLDTMVANGEMTKEHADAQRKMIRDGSVIVDSVLDSLLTIHYAAESKQRAGREADSKNGDAAAMDAIAKEGGFTANSAPTTFPSQVDPVPLLDHTSSETFRTKFMGGVGIEK